MTTQQRREFDARLRKAAKLIQQADTEGILRFTAAVRDYFRRYPDRNPFAAPSEDR